MVRTSSAVQHAHRTARLCGRRAVVVTAVVNVQKIPIFKTGAELGFLSLFLTANQKEAHHWFYTLSCFNQTRYFAGKKMF